VNTECKATGNTSKLEKIRPVYMSNKTWTWRKVCVDRQIIPYVNNTFSEERRTSITIIIILAIILHVQRVISLLRRRSMQPQ